MSAQKRRSDIESDPTKEPRFAAAVELVGRTGADQFQMRYSDEESPTVWVALALYGDQWECAAAMHPLRALFRLCETLMDGGTCIHCNRPAGFSPDLDPSPMPLSKEVCWYQWDPELKTYRRGCEGDGK